MKRALLILIALTVSAALILVTLDRLMGNPNSSLNGFNRKFIKTEMNLVNEFILNNARYQIAGAEGNKIYLETPKAGDLTVLDLSNNTTTGEKINIPVIDKLEPAFSTSVRYPEIYITGTNARKFIRGNLETGRAEIFDIATGPVLSTEVIDDNNAIIRCVDTTTFDLKFHKINFKTNEISGTANVSPVKSDDMFAYDGKLSFDRASNKFWYVNYYCNGITTFDSTLKLIRLNSIDTMSTPRAPVVHTTGSITHKKPPVSVNKGSFVYKGRLYVHSALRGDNEELLTEKTVIDMYEPAYRGSFYIPVPSHDFVQAEFLDDGRLAVLLKDRVLVYRLNALLQ